MGLADAVIAALVLAGALYLLYRSLWKGGGACAGCASGGACRAPRRAAAPLVQLGARPGTAGGRAGPPPACHPE